MTHRHFSSIIGTFSNHRTMKSKLNFDDQRGSSLTFFLGEKKRKRSIEQQDFRLESLQFSIEFQATPSWSNVKIRSLGGGNSNLFYVHPYLGKWAILTSIFFRWVAKEPPTVILSRPLLKNAVVISSRPWRRCGQIAEAGHFLPVFSRSLDGWFWMVILGHEKLPIPKLPKRWVR